VRTLSEAWVTLRNADPADKAEVYRQLSLELTYSRNNPFWDESHWYAGFRDDEGATIAAAARAAGDQTEP
jgi:hypothetical protein